MSFIAAFLVGQDPNKVHLFQLGVTSLSLFFKLGEHIYFISFFFLPLAEVFLKQIPATLEFALCLSVWSPASQRCPPCQEWDNAPFHQGRGVAIKSPGSSTFPRLLFITLPRLTC